MHGRHPNSHPTRRRREVREEANGRLLALVMVVALVVAGLIVIAGSNDGRAPAVDAPEVEAAAPAAEPAALVQPDPGQPDSAADQPDEEAAAGIDEQVAERPSVDLEGCMLQVIEIHLGDEGESVECLQKALYAAGYYDGEFTGEFDAATDVAVRAVQVDRELYVDGIVGAKTATSLGIWPGDESFIVRTDPPPPGATDLWGMPLSPVASAGDDAPPLPDDAGQGTGYRIVYSRAMQRVWAINDAEQIVRSYLVTGSQYHNEIPGKHKVYSRSEVTTAWNGAADLPLMVRWLDTERGAIGFHAIPKHRDTGEPYQTIDQLGQKLSGGCQRQTMLDAQFMWAFGEIGTPVWVL